MSGVAKDDINPSSAPEETVSAVGDAEAGHVKPPMRATPRKARAVARRICASWRTMKTSPSRRSQFFP